MAWLHYANTIPQFSDWVNHVYSSQFFVPDSTRIILDDPDIDAATGITFGNFRRAREVLAGTACQEGVEK